MIDKISEEFKVGPWRYRLESVKCGKKNCKCNTLAELHGPYWYAYTRRGDKIISVYIGRRLILLHSDEGKSLLKSRSKRIIPVPDNELTT